MIRVRRAGPADAGGVADVFIASFRATYPEFPVVHSEPEVRGWIADHVVRDTECWIAVDGLQVIAMLSLTPGWVEHLYVAPDRLGAGLGRCLLDLAKERSLGGLELWTFQANRRARRFYERNGFVAVELTDGAGNEERQPDVRYRWSPDAG